MSKRSELSGLLIAALFYTVTHVWLIMAVQQPLDAQQGLTASMFLSIVSVTGLSIVIGLSVGPDEPWLKFAVPFLGILIETGGMVFFNFTGSASAYTTFLLAQSALALVAFIVACWCWKERWSSDHVTSFDHAIGRSDGRGTLPHPEEDR